MTDEQRIFLESNGFLTIANALSPEHLARIQSAASGAYEKWKDDFSLPGVRSEVLDQIQSPIEYDDELLSLLWHPSVFPLVREILGEDVMMIDNDFFITPPRTPRTHAGWHHDVGMRGVYHPLSVMMVKVFFLLSDVDENSGGTAMVPGSHRFPLDFRFPSVSDPREMPGMVQMTGRAGTAYLFNGRVYHCAVNNDSDRPRRVLIYNYGHFWMKMWPGYEPSPRLLDAARSSGDPVRMQLLGIGDAYGQSLS
ncbi:phytanoyl-CoA dioxygenase family protein [Fimbriimonas ginsengisoli]|uniref:phytanoyl-CoA dioxygenase family protein n=1 Tax=Fimbriimonas ginsengisoli TaxID=1005039 RepID=UPI00130EA4FB|nr:phytanoyl-CoA dioxygenase family protein [Fimbriimonas ginsengisoli]